MWGDHAGDEKNGSLINLWRLKTGIPKEDNNALFRSLLAFGMPDMGWEFRDEKPVHPPIDWKTCVEDLDPATLAEYRGWSLEYCQWLKANSRIGIDTGDFAWPIFENGKVVGTHNFFLLDEPRVEPPEKGIKLTPLIWDLDKAESVHIFESQWDAASVQQVLSGKGKRAFIITRGESNAGKVAGLLPKNSIKVWIWPQNDKPGDDGSIPSERWLECILKIMASEGRTVRVVRLREDKDHNDLLKRLGSTDAMLKEIKSMIEAAQVIEPPKVEPAPGMPEDVAARVKAVTEEYDAPVIYNRDGKISGLNQRWFAKWFSLGRPDLQFELKEKFFYQYEKSSGLFTELQRELILEGVAQTISVASRTWGPDWASLYKFNSHRVLSDITSLLCGIIGGCDVFVSTHPYIHVANGMLLFNKDIPEDPVAIRPFSPDYRSRNRSEIAYKPEAQCPEFKDRILGHLNESDRRLLQIYAGQCLIGRNLSQRLLLLSGVGGSSKSAFVLILAAIVGHKNVMPLRTHLLGDRFEIGRMVGKTLLIGPDVRGDFLSHPGAQVLKSLTGGDHVHAEIKNSNARFDLHGNFNCVITCNEDPRVSLRGDRSAWGRRLLVVTYKEAFKGKRVQEIDKYLVAKEREGILAWCVQGAQLLLSDLQTHGDILLSPEQNERITRLLDESDSIRLFVSGELVATSESIDLTESELREAYFNFCADKEWPPICKDFNKRAEILIGDYFHITKSNDVKRDGKNQRGYHGLRRKNSEI